MAQNQGSFLYKLKLDLDAAGAASQFDKHLESMSVAVQDFGLQLSKMQSKIKDAFSEGPQFEGALNDVRRKFNQIEQDAVEGFSRAQQQLHGLADRMNRDLEGVVQNAARLETAGGQAFSQLRNTADIQSSTPSMASGAAQNLRGNARGVKKSLIETKQAFTTLQGRGSASIEQLANDFSGLGSDVSNLRKDLSTLMGNLEATGQSLRDLATDNPFDHIEEGARRAPRAINEMRQEVLQSEASLKDLAASADRSWGRITNGALEAADGAEKMSASIVQSSNQATSALKEQAAATTRVRGTTFSLGSTASSAASQLSIDLTQSAQDAAFGLENLAASAPFLAEQFGRVRRESSNFIGALSSLGSAFMGPTGVIAAFTLALTFKDELVSLFQSIIEGATGASSAIEKFGNTLDEEIRGFEDSEELVSLFANLEQGTERYTEVQGILQEALNQNVNAIDEFETAITSAIKGIDSYDKAVEKLDRHQLDRIVRSGFREVASINNFPEFQKRLKQLRTAQKGVADAMNAMNIESLEQMTLTNRLQENYPLTRKEARKMAQVLLEEKKAREKANEEAETTLELQKRLREARVEAMEEGISKEINSINLSIQARRREIKAIEAQTEKQKKQKEQLLDLLDRVAARKKEAALEEFTDVDFERQDGESFIETQNRVNDKIDERIRKIKNLEGKYASLNEEQRQDAISELEQQRSEDLGELRENTILVPGLTDGPVPTDQFIENQEEQLNRAEQRIGDRLRTLRFEQEQGRVGGTLFGNDALGGVQNAKKQRKLIEQRTKLKEARIEQRESELAGRLAANEIGQERFLEQKRRLEKKRNRIHKKAAQKRFQITLQNMRKIGNAVESSPIGDATRNLLLDLGAMWQAHSEDRLNFAEKNWKKQATLIGQMGGQVVGAAATIAEQTFQSWKSERAQDLKDEGKTAKERRKILKKEGKKRFKVMKAIKITEASVNTATGVTRALAELPPPASYAAAAATAAAGLFRIKQIASMSIGDRIGGSGGGGQGGPGGKFTQRAAATSASQALDTGTGMAQQRNNDEDKINKTASKVGREVGKQMPDKVTMDRKTAAEANDAAQKQQAKLNK